MKITHLHVFLLDCLTSFAKYFSLQVMGYTYSKYKVQSLLSDLLSQLWLNIYVNIVFVLRNQFTSTCTW